MHPLKLEMDEAQDYVEAGWVELGETLKYADPRATWRSHGVSRGVRDRYYKQTQPESGWYVHRYTAMHRPDWTAEERKAKAELYGSRDHPDYRRNILGLHGDASSALFVLHRLMACVDQETTSAYNTEVYTHIRINDERLRESGMPIEDMIDFPASHKKFVRTWAGMDVGVTNHPSEIVIFGEEPKPRSEDVRLRTLARVHLERISTPDQRRVMERIWKFYKPQGFGMDRTGLGLPIYQEIMAGKNQKFAACVKPYNFSEKIVVGWEQPGEGEEVETVEGWVEGDATPGKPIMGNVLEYSSDTLRLLVDQARLVLPWDIDMLREFQGQTYVITKSGTDAYGKRNFNKGKFHALDGVRMAVLAFRQHEVEKMVALMEEDDHEAVLDSFLDSY